MGEDYQEEPSTPEEQGLDQEPAEPQPETPESVPQDDPDTRNQPPDTPGGGREMPGNTG